MVLIGQDPPERPADASEAVEAQSDAEGTDAGAGGGAVPPEVPDSDVAGEPRRPSSRRRLVAGVLALVAVAAIVVELVLLLSAQSRESSLKSLDSARTSALAAARTYSVEIASYNYQTLQQDFQKVEQHGTTSFQAQYSQSSKALMSVLTAYHAVATATVLAAGLESATTSKAVAVVFLNQTVTNSTQKKPTTDQSRVEITLVQQKGQWLIDQLNLV